MDYLPSDLQAFADLLGTQPAEVRQAFRYFLCLMMVETGKLRLIRSVPGEGEPQLIFESSAGERFSVAKPRMTGEQEAELLASLRAILDAQGLP